MYSYELQAIVTVNKTEQSFGSNTAAAYTCRSLYFFEIVTHMV